MYAVNRNIRKNNPEPSGRRWWNTAYRTIVRCGRDFCLYTSIHGFNHIAWPGRHWVERLLWLSVTSAAIWGAIAISLGQLQRYNENPTVITLEKDFRTWRFNLPALTTCELNRVNPLKLPAAIASRWHVAPSDPKYDYYARFVATVANSDLFSLHGYQEFKDDSSLEVDLYALVVEVMPDIEVKSTWSPGTTAKWIPAITEAGACYVTNSVAIADVAIVKPSINDTKHFPMTCKYSSLSCYVILEIVTHAFFFFHSPYDVVDMSVSNHTIYPSLNRLTELGVMETGCGVGVRGLRPPRRGCRFTDEPRHATQVYSTNACRLSCRNQLAIKLCGCKPFYYIYEEGPLCTPAGMACLASYSQQLKGNGGTKCSCSQPCLDATFKEIFTSDEIWSKGPFSNRGSVRFTIQPPRTRYTREIVFFFQDLVVSFGGAAGLFLGASFISFVEILYFLIERVLGACRRKQDVTPVAEVQRIVPYETTRIMELTSILEQERKYEEEMKYETPLTR